MDDLFLQVAFIQRNASHETFYLFVFALIFTNFFLKDDDKFSHAFTLYTHRHILVDTSALMNKLNIFFKFNVLLSVNLVIFIDSTIEDFYCFLYPPISTVPELNISQ